MMAATEVTAKRMNMTEIIKKAKTIGIDPGRMKKAELIRSIQRVEDCNPCFGISDGQCAYAECCFMPDCFKTSLAEHKQTAEQLTQQIGELTAANEQLQQEITERQQGEDDMEQYCNRLGQRIEEKAVELTSANDKLQHQIVALRPWSAPRKRALIVFRRRDAAAIAVGRRRLSSSVRRLGRLHSWERTRSGFA